MLTAVLFELDGVLVDTSEMRAQSIAAAFAAEGVRVDVPAEAYARSDPIDDLVREVAASHARTSGAVTCPLDDTALALIALRAEREYRAQLAAGVTLADGAQAAVDALGAAYRLGVVTAWHHVDAERTLALGGLGTRIRFVLAADDAPAFASAARRLAYAVARLQRGTPHTTTSDSSVAAIVAGTPGLAAAHAAGARAVLVQTLGLLRDLTPARLAAALGATPPTAAPR